MTDYTSIGGWDGFASRAPAISLSRSGWRMVSFYEIRGKKTEKHVPERAAPGVAVLSRSIHRCFHDA